MAADRREIAVAHPMSAGSRIAAIGVAAALLAGALTVYAPAIAVTLPLLGLAILGLTLSPCYWALAAVVAAICSRAAVALGIFPGFAAYIDLPLAWGAFGFAALTARSWSPIAQWVTLGVGGLALAVAGSGMLAGASAVQSLFAFALLGAPFALVGAILLAPPSGPQRRRIIATALALAYVQVPVTVVQALGASHPDEVQGTFVGSEAGAHLVGAVAAVAALWIIGRSRTGVQALAALPLLVVPVLSGAEAVLFALPIALLAAPARTRIARRLRIALTVGVLAILLGSLALRPYPLEVFERALGGDSGKVEAAREIGGELTDSPHAFLLGKGPAGTVSFSAVLSLDPLTDPDTPVRFLDLQPSRMLLELGGESPAFSSFLHPASSALGVIGDFGLLGALIYLILAGYLFASAWRRRTSDAAGAAAALALFIVLGIVFIWWEQTGFSLYVALIAGLALADRQRSGERLESHDD